MPEGTKISNHLSVLNGIVLELEVIGVKIEDEDKALRLLWSLPTSYKHLLPTLIYGKKTIDLEEVTSKKEDWVVKVLKLHISQVW